MKRCPTLRSLVQAGLCIICLVAPSGCRRLQDDQARPRPPLTRMPTPPAADQEPTQLLGSVRDLLLEHCPDLAKCPADIWIGFDVSGDMLGDNLLLESEQLVQDMARHFFVPEDWIIIAPWDNSMRDDLREEVTLSKGDNGDPYSAISPLLPPANPGNPAVTSGQQRGSLLSVAQASLLREAIGAQSGRPALILILTNIAVDNPHGSVWSDEKPETIDRLVREFSGSDQFPRRDFRHPSAPDSPRRLYVWYLARPGSPDTVAAARGVDRRAGVGPRGPDPASGELPWSQTRSSDGANPGWVVFAGCLFFIAVAAAAIIASMLRVQVAINGGTDNLRFLMDQGEIVGDVPNPARKTWSVSLDNPGHEGAPIATVRMSQGKVTVEATDGVSFADRGVEDAQITDHTLIVLPGGSAHAQIQGHYGPGRLQIEVRNWREQNAALATGLIAALLVGVFSIIGFVIA